MVTFNRLAYTRRALESVLASDYPNFELTIWDNASSDGTRPWLAERIAEDSRISLVLSNCNVGCAHPMNVVWGNARTPLVAKVDNDTVVPRNLIQQLAKYHMAHRQLGVISGCHFHPDDMQAVKDSCAEHAVASHSLNEELLEANHVGGCAVMMRRSLFAEFGPILCQKFSSDEPYLESGWTDYQERLHQAGYTNGYPLPLIYVDHMEDTRSEHHRKSPDEERYKLTMRGKSLAACTESLYVEGAQKLRSSARIKSLFSGSADVPKDGVVTLFVPLAGRSQQWKQLAYFLDNQTWPSELLQLIFCDTSQDEDFSRLVGDWISSGVYPNTMVVRQAVGEKGIADMPRREATQAVQAAVAAIYNRARALVNTEFLWILEDDIVPPLDVLSRLLASMDDRCCSSAAPYRSRFGDRFVAWDKSNKNYTTPMSGVTEVGGNGLGCVLLRSDVFCRTAFAPSRDCDRQLYQRLASTHWRVRMDWSCECVHGLVEDSAATDKSLNREEVS